MSKKNSNMSGDPRLANRANKMGDGDMITKRLTLPLGTVVSTAGGVIAVDTTTDTTQVQTAPASEWASFAARYQQYRVRAVTLILTPAYPASGSPVAGVSPQGAHSALYVGDFIGTSVPASAAQILSDEGSVVLSTCKDVRYTVTWARNPNAKLWAPTTGAVPAANSYGVAFASNATAGTLAISAAYYTRTIVWDVEFRGSQ